MSKIQTKKLVEGVWQNLERFPHISYEGLQDYVAAIEQSPTKRARICMHDATTDRQQEMFIAFDGSSYVRPSHHVNRDESFHMIDGAGKYIFFDDNGVQIDDVRLGNYESDLPFYCRIPGNLNHSLVLYSDHAVAHEVCTGPFDKASTVFPSWSPDYKTSTETDQFRAFHTTQPVKPVQGCQYERITEEMCRAKPGVVSIKRSDLEYFKSEVYKTARKRIRLCVHQTDDDLLHEMFVVYTGMTYVRANKHIGKDESLHILEGEADFVFFDDDGNIIEIVPLGSKSSNKNFFVRVPQGVFHTIIMKSDVLVIHEATPGPFNREETLWASWSPIDSDQEAVAAYSKDLAERMERFS